MRLEEFILFSLGGNPAVKQTGDLIEEGTNPQQRLVTG